MIVASQYIMMKVLDKKRLLDKEKYDKAKEEINRESIECLKENYSYSFGVYTDLFSFLNIIDPIE